MKQTIVPAQITSVEDRIIGSLTLTQIVLLITPIIFSFGVFALLPKALKFNLYKMIIACLAAGIFWFMAIRYKGKTMLFWTIIVLRFFLRPTHYVYNKNTCYLKNQKIYKQEQKIKKKSPINIKKKIGSTKPNEKDYMSLNNLLDDPNFKLSFIKTKKAGLNVQITKTR